MKQTSSSQQFLSLAYPVILIVFLGLVVMAWSLDNARSRQMEIVAELSEHTMAVTLLEKQKNLDLVLADYANWDESLAFAKQPDEAWAKREIGANILEPFDLSASLILDQNGTILWWKSREEALDRQALEEALWRDHVMPRLMEDWQKVPAPAKSAYLALNGSLYSLHGGLITSDEGDYLPTNQDRAALVLLKRIDDHFLRELREHKQATDLQLSVRYSLGDAGLVKTEPLSKPEMFSLDGVLRASLPLADMTGQPVADLSWYPAFSVDSIFEAIGPGIVLVMVLMLGCFVWYVSRVRQGVALLDHEIQARKDAEEALEGHRRQLEQLVEERTQALFEALAKVQAASNEKTRFSSQMSHEMRTPLNAISGFAQLLQEDVTDPDQRDSLAEIVKASRRLTDIVDQALKLVCLEEEAASLPHGECEPLVILSGMLARYGAQCQQKGIGLKDSGLDQQALCPITADTMREVFRVLLDNALQYTDSGKEIRLEAEVVAKEVRIRCCDEGYGIPPEKVSLLFQPFSRLHFDLLPNIEGVGLGLFMARKKLRAYGADISYEAVATGGSCFELRLPLYRNQD